MLDYIIGAQGLYYLVTGLWPIIHLSSFEVVTGPKASIFLLYMISFLTVVIAITLLLSFNKEKSREIIFLSLASPLAFMINEVLFRGQIRGIYFLDFAIEVIFIALILFGVWTTRKIRIIENLEE